MKSAVAKNFSESSGYRGKMLLASSLPRSENPRRTSSYDEDSSDDGNKGAGLSGKFFKQLNAVATIALRDLTKLLRDKPRMVASLIFPIIFIGVLGGGLNASFGGNLGFDLLTFIFTGILAQTMFTSTASGVDSNRAIL